MEVIMPEAADQGLMGIKTPLLDHHYKVDEDEVIVMNKTLILPGTRRQLTEEEEEENGTDDEEKDDSFSNNTYEKSDISEVNGRMDTQNSTTNVYFDNKEGVSSKVGKNLKGKDLDVDIQEILTAVINGNTTEADSTEVGKNVKGMDLDVDIQEILTAVINGKTEADTRAQTENLQVDIVDEIDEEVIELEFERAVEKIHAHHDYEMYCPNCSNRITKVVLRRRIVKKIPTTSDKPLDLLGCLSCFSIFVAAGNKLNPFRMFGWDKETRSSSSVSSTQSIVQQQQASTLSSATQTNNITSTTITTSSSTKVNDVTSTISSSSTQVNGTTSTVTSSSTQVKGKVFDLLSIFKNGRVQEKDRNVQSSTVMTIDKTTKQGSTAGDRVQVSSQQGSEFEGNAIIDINEDLVKVLEQRGRLRGGEIEESDVTASQQQGDDVHVNIGEESVQTGTHEFIQNLTICKLPVIMTEEPSSISLEVVKSIVYGGLMESIASLSIVSSGAASGVTTMNILALGLANLVSGLVILGTNFRDMKYGENSESDEAIKKYKEIFGRKEHFLIHAVVGVLSYIAFGMVPLVTYGFAFRVSDNRDYKILAVAGASLFCIIILSIMKAYTRGQHKFSVYFKTVVYYITCAAMVSGIAFAVGDLASKLTEKWGLWDSSPVNALFLKETRSINPTFASY